MTEHKYITMEELMKNPRYPFTMGQLRSFALKRDENGLSRATRKIGKRLYFRTDLFDEWIESHLGSKDEKNVNV